MIKKIKIYGERNSGTNFLYKLLVNNLELKTIEMHEFDKKNNIVRGWKHGIPNEFGYYTKLYDCTLFIYIIRPIEDWLVSSYYHPYHVKRKNNFNQFLTETMKSNEKKWKRKNGKILNSDDNGKTIFEIRYYKLNKHLEFFTNVDNIIHINLSLLQSNPKSFIEFISTTFNLIRKTDFIPVLLHTKTRKKEKNQSYKLDLTNKHRDIINKNKSIIFEKYIDILKEKIYYKKNKITNYYSYPSLKSSSTE
jgi:hypothetical protein